jgi:RuvB-like protein 1 (pontin 52)
MADIAPAPAVAPATAAGPTILTQPPPPTNQRESRIATHSHIKGLGLADDGTAMEQSQGFVGQRQAREALGLHLSLLRMGRHSGRPLLLVGPPGTGKVGTLTLGERIKMKLTV